MIPSSDLVKIFRRQHAGVAQYLEIFSKVPPACVETEKFGSLLMAHLELEDKEFYPRLFQANSVRGAIVTAFQIGMKDLLKTIGEFIGTWSEKEPLSNRKAFLEDMDMVMRHLHIRIKSEEEKLYPMFIQDHEARPAARV